MVDVANVLGSRADGWWRDRAGATTRLLARIGGLPGTSVTVPARAQGGDAAEGVVTGVAVVLEGAARRADAPPEVVVVNAPGSGDDTIVAVVRERVEAGGDVVVVTADRGLRSRLPEVATIVGPDWLNRLIGR